MQNLIIWSWVINIISTDNWAERDHPWELIVAHLVRKFTFCRIPIFITESTFLCWAGWSQSTPSHRQDRCLLFGRNPVRILTGTLAIRIEVSKCFPQTFKQNSWNLATIASLNIISNSSFTNHPTFQYHVVFWANSRIIKEDLKINHNVIFYFIKIQFN